MDGFTILPPTNSSKDATIQLNITSTDTNGSDTNIQTKTLPIKVTVNPVAEIIGVFLVQVILIKMVQR